MIQAIGLTSASRRERPPAVDNVSLEACPGRVTALLGAPGAGKTTTLRLMLELQRGRGITYFAGRPLHRVEHPPREVGAVLGDVPGHPARTVRGHLRLLCAAVGVPGRRADEVLEAVGLVSLRDTRLGALPHGIDRRLGVACALLADPHTLVLDAPAHGLPVRERRWLHGTLRAHAAQGGTVLFTTRDAKEAARHADHVITLDSGRLVADQPAADFARIRLRPRVAVRSPHAARLAALLAKEARDARRPVEVVREDGNRLSVYGTACADVGETAFRHGILVHRLTEETGDMGPTTADDARPSGAPASAAPTPGDRAEPVPAAAPHAARAEASATVTPPPAATEPSHAPVTEASADRAATPVSRTAAAPPTTAAPAAAGDQPPLAPLPPLPPPITVRPARAPTYPLRYELRRAAGTGAGRRTVVAALAGSVLLSLVLARIGHTPGPSLLVAWPQELPLPPAALGAGLLGALAFGEEFRHPVLAADRGAVPRRPGLLIAKLAVAAATAVLLAVLTVGCDLEALHLLYGREVGGVPADWPSAVTSWIGLVVGCSWAGVLAAGIFRSTSAGLAAVLSVPVLVVPLVHTVQGAGARIAAGLSAQLRELAPVRLVRAVRWPFGGEEYLTAAARAVGQPVGGALLLSLAGLLGAYLLTTLRGGAR
ncbi:MULTISPECIES: ATP-binding cassette domain-containing protein [Streptomyces]|uniref:ATP-binding cassette domain-containing protein n=1 Tax=Streptomyces TaxID=1883 RepID=UPI00166FE030|nr:ABC transporter ATP-binding protein [Streptomyces ruber]